MNPLNIAAPEKAIATVVTAADSGNPNCSIASKYAKLRFEKDLIFKCHYARLKLTYLSRKTKLK